MKKNFNLTQRLSNNIQHNNSLKIPRTSNNSKNKSIKLITRNSNVCFNRSLLTSSEKSIKKKKYC